MRHPKDVSLLASAVISLNLVAGCATQERMANTAIDAHLAQENASNQMLLLNIVRASLRRPLHFSKIDSMTLTVGSEMPSIDLSLGFGPGADNRARGVKLSGGGAPTTMDVTPLESKEFIQALTTPLSADWMDYFLGQGWPKKTVLTLFIERIDGLDGLPRAGSAADQISAWAKCSSLELKLSPGPEYGPPLPLAQLTSGVSLVDALKAGITVKEITPLPPGGPAHAYQLQAPGSENRLNFRGCPGESQSRPAGAKGKPPRGQNILIKSNDPRQAGPAALAAGTEHKEDGAEPEPGIVLILRSAERMIRYLGENAMAEPKLLLEVHHSKAPEKAAVRVNYGGSEYWIAADDATGDDAKSIETLALMQQILLLKSSGNAAPAATQSLRIRVTR